MTLDPIILDDVAGAVEVQPAVPVDVTRPQGARDVEGDEDEGPATIGDLAAAAAKLAGAAGGVVGGELAAARAAREEARRLSGSQAVAAEAAARVRMSVMDAIHAADGPVRQRDIIAATGIARSTVSRALQALVGDGLVVDTGAGYVLSDAARGRHGDDTEEDGAAWLGRNSGRHARAISRCQASRWSDRAMDTYRSASREAGIMFRMSRADRDRLREEAHGQGMSVQEMFELRMLGYSRPVPVKPGRPRRRQQNEELPLTG